MEKVLYELASDTNNDIVSGCREGYKVDFGLGHAVFDVCGTFLYSKGVKGVETMAKSYLGDKACGY